MNQIDRDLGSVLGNTLNSNIFKHVETFFLFFLIEAETFSFFITRNHTTTTKVQARDVHEYPKTDKGQATRISFVVECKLYR